MCGQKSWQKKNGQIYALSPSKNITDSDICCLGYNLVSETHQYLEQELETGWRQYADNSVQI